MKVAYEMAIYRIYVVEVRKREKYLHKFRCSVRTKPIMYNNKLKRG
jgi:hypothetical protein